MKKILIITLLLGAFSAFAEEVQILNAEIGYVNRQATVDTSFQMDKTTGQGNVKVMVTEVIYDHFPGPMNCDQWGRCYPQYNRMPRYITIFNKTVEVQGLTLDGDKVMFEGNAGPVHCGTMGISRVLRRPTLFLNGNCKLSGRVSNRGVLSVIMKTK